MDTAFGGSRQRDRDRSLSPVRPTQQAMHCEVLEAIATGRRLGEVADLLCRRMEALLPRVACSILAVDPQRRLRPLAAPSLPTGFAEVVDGVEIGPDAGACGAAAFGGSPVGSRDIARDPAWRAYNALPLAAGFRACWSSPVVGPTGLVTGTFALYFRRPRGPSRREIRIVQRCVHLCALAMKHEAAVSDLEQTNRRLDAALGNVCQGLCFFDGEQRLLVANGQFAEVYGMAPGLVRPGMSLREIVDLRWSAGSGPAMSREDYLTWRDSLQAVREPTDTVVELASGRFVNIRSRPMPGGGWVSTHEDVTERLLADQRILHLASHDTLTGLPNRVLFRERLEAALGAPGHSLVVLCLDLDRFKSVNDTHGHPVGDQILLSAARRLQACVRAGDTVTRLGGDEFAILLPGVGRPETARELTSKLLQVLRDPHVVEGRELVVGASLGAAVAPRDGDTPDLLLKHADAALYRAKKERGTAIFFEPEMISNLHARETMKGELRDALASGAFELEYQPLVDLHDRSVVGLEALVRWRHPDRGSVAPLSFIPFAEETGLIVPIGDWVLGRACMAASTWPSGVNLAVNVSAAQLASSEILKSIDRAIASARLDPGRLELEITETALLDDTRRVLGVLRGIRDRGIRISLDDFGTGSSSLRHIQAFPFDKIKIDRSFVQKIAVQRESLAIVRAVAGLGRSLGVRTTAEGVETSQQLTMIESEGCSEAQGYLLGGPMPEAGVIGFLSSPRELQGADAGRPAPNRGAGSRSHSR